jgi:CheY-like chemotaxis protein
MTAASATEVLIAAPDIDDRLLECLADCRATLVRTFDEAKQALRERLFKMIVIDLNFDDVRMFDLLHHVRSRADCNDVPVVCVQASDAGDGLGAAFDRLVKMFGGKGFVDLRARNDTLAGAFQPLCRIVAGEPHDERANGATRDCNAASRDHERPLCILVIDQDVDAAHQLGELLEQAGHDVDFAYNDAAGLDAARHLRPDLVFLNLARPQLDGYQMARRLRHEPDMRDAKIIAITANEQRQPLVEAGFDGYLKTPLDGRSIQRILWWYRSGVASEYLY